jgi:hypothetical protein
LRRLRRERSRPGCGFEHTIDVEVDHELLRERPGLNLLAVEPIGKGHRQEVADIDHVSGSPGDSSTESLL